jgi:hypothetical protein
VESRTAPTLHVACLCAAWCRLRDSYASVLKSVTGALVLEGLPLQVHWIDIEDDADLMGDLDVETFPTIVVAAGPQVLFAGAVTPQPETLRRLVQATLSGLQEDAPRPSTSPEVQAFAARLAGRPGSDALDG